ncbi:hypothetical protein E1B28_008937 [Marasmius oreades]|uniref:Uncharacterized protein n=1 Tax=Marasmius oreades TaxID=181124 RepID=A0A9P7RZG2_9AGAR|nr:uncharacterized protein E1B28_008937 [Marasmius oreades]KAG7092594.1 hypothetical protein E1B28_008937 [Marasmius oreades]
MMRNGSLRLIACQYLVPHPWEALYESSEMLFHRGFSAWIVVNGQPLPEYLVAVNSDTHQVSCWIPSEEGQRFSVHWQDHGGNVDTCAFISLDGFIAPGRFLFGCGATSRFGVRTSQNTERPFVFRKVTESTVLSPSSTDVGMIVLKIKRIKRTGQQPVDTLQRLSHGPQGSRQQGDIYVGFGEESQAFERWDYTWKVEPHTDGTGDTSSGSPTYVSFVFRYRSYEFLQAQGIVPPMSSSSSTTPTGRGPVRRIMSAPAVPNNGQPPPPLPNSSFKIQRHVHELSAGFPSSIHRNSPEARRTTSWVPSISMALNSGYPGTHLLVNPRGPEEYYRSTNSDSQ